MRLKHLKRWWRLRDKPETRHWVLDDKYYVVHEGGVFECDSLETVIVEFAGKGEIAVIKGDMLDMSGYDLSEPI